MHKNDPSKKWFRFIEGERELQIYISSPVDLPDIFNSEKEQKQNRYLIENRGENES